MANKKRSDTNWQIAKAAHKDKDIDLSAMDKQGGMAKVLKALIAKHKKTFAAYDVKKAYKEVFGRDYVRPGAKKGVKGNKPAAATLSLSEQLANVKLIQDELDGHKKGSKSGVEVIAEEIVKLKMVMERLKIGYSWEELENILSEMGGQVRTPQQVKEMGIPAPTLKTD